MRLRDYCHFPFASHLADERFIDHAHTSIGPYAKLESTAESQFQ